MPRLSRAATMRRLNRVTISVSPVLGGIGGRKQVLCPPPARRAPRQQVAGAFGMDPSIFEPACHRITLGGKNRGHAAIAHPRLCLSEIAEQADVAPVARARLL